MGARSDDDELQAGMASGLMGGPGQASTPGLGGTFMQMLQQSPLPDAGFPPPVSPDIPGGMEPLKRALAALTAQRLPDPVMSKDSIDNVGVAPLRSIPTTVDKGVTSATSSTPAVTTSKLDLDKAVGYLDKNALPAYDKEKAGNCAKAVRLAIGAGGLDVALTPYAKDYGPNLVRAGYTQLDADARKAYTPQRGDVIIYPAAPNHPSGHMEMYDGKQWVSDFKQKGPVPFGDGTLPYEVYRP